jgi:hypothetical protein
MAFIHGVFFLAGVLKPSAPFTILAKSRESQGVYNFFLVVLYRTKQLQYKLPVKGKLVPSGWRLAEVALGDLGESGEFGLDIGELNKELVAVVDALAGTMDRRRRKAISSSTGTSSSPIRFLLFR